MFYRTVLFLFLVACGRWSAGSFGFWSRGALLHSPAAPANLSAAMKRNPAPALLRSTIIT